MFLHPSEMATRLRLGKEIEQWLSYEQEADYNFIRWISISKDRNLFTITYLESIDEGSADFHDVHAFSALDPEDAPYGITNEFESIEAAVSFAMKEYGAATNRFVSQGMIQQEYANYSQLHKRSS